MVPHIGHVFEYLNAERTLAHNDVGVIERWDHRQSAIFLVRARTRIGVIKRCAEQFRLSTQSANGVQLGVRSRFGHHDERPYAQLLGSEGHTLGVVSRARSDDTPLKLSKFEFLQGIESTAYLERARALEVFRLEIYFNTQLLGKILAETGGSRPQIR